MKVAACCSVLASLLLVVPADAADTVLVEGVIPSQGPFPLYGEYPAIAPTRDGFAVVWEDYEPTGPYSAKTHLRFARYDLGGRRTADSGWLDIDVDAIFGYYGPYGHELVDSGDGFVSFLGYDASEIWTLALRPDGTQAGAASRALTSGEFYPFSVASGSGGSILLTYPEWIGTWTTWAVPFGADGGPSGPRSNIAPGVSRRAGYPIWDSPVAAVRGGFATAWELNGTGVRVRDLGRDGTPSGGVVLVADESSCPQTAGIAGVGGAEAIVFAAGCDQTDLYLSVRANGAAPSPPIALTSEPVDEGSRSFDFIRALRVAGGADTLAVLYTILVPYPGGGYSYDLALARYDLAGALLGARTLLGRDLGIVADHDVDLAWDPYHSRYLLAWAGSGPQGYGVYVMAVPSR